MSILDNSGDSRRHFLIRSAACLGVAALGGPALLGCAPKEVKAEVTATEDLMRDHGALQRLLLIYEEIARRLQCCQEFSPTLLTDATGLIRRLIQEHHEKLEEEHVFPIFEKTGQMVALVKILGRQHEAGRKLLDTLQSQGGPGHPHNFVQRAQLEAGLRLFARLYRPHAAREDTMLFPALRALMSPPQFLALGKRLEDLKQANLGPDGSAKMILEVGELEKALGISDLEQFTPKF